MIGDVFNITAFVTHDSKDVIKFLNGSLLVGFDLGWSLPVTTFMEKSDVFICWMWCLECYKQRHIFLLLDSNT